MFAALVLPPYCTRTDLAALSPKSPAIVPLMSSRMTFSAYSGVAAFPVPIAQIGS